MRQSDKCSALDKLADGFVAGERVSHDGKECVVVGPPAMARAAKVSVSVRYANGEESPTVKLVHLTMRIDKFGEAITMTGPNSQQSSQRCTFAQYAMGRIAPVAQPATQPTSQPAS